MLRLFQLAFLALFTLPTIAHAQDCTNPDGYTGVILYNQSFDTFQGCTLRGWMAFHDADSTPPPDFAFNFVDQSDVTQSTLINSNIVQVSGLGTSIPITITGQGNPQFRSCSDASCTTEINTWGSASINVSDNDYLQLRLTSSPSSLETLNVFLIGGGSTQTWSVRTELVDDCADPSPAPGSICPDGTVFAGMSPDGNVKMYTTRCDEGMSWNGSTCTGSRVSLPWNNGSLTFTTTGVGSSFQGEANTNTLDVLSDAGAPYYPADRCADLVAHGNSDWYLPASQELTILYLNRIAIGQFQSGWAEYWASHENGNSRAWFVNFSNGSNGHQQKNIYFPIRCVRR